MLRTYLSLIVSAAVYTVLGVGLGLLWWAATGRTDMPLWLLVVLVGVVTGISSVAEHVLHTRRVRRRRQAALARHGKPAAR